MERVRAEFPQGPGAGLPDDEGNRLYQDLRELEFDREVGKLSEADYQALRERYERQAVRRLAESRESPTPDPEPEITQTTGARGSRRSWAPAAWAVVLLAGGNQVPARARAEAAVHHRDTVPCHIVPCPVGTRWRAVTRKDRDAGDVGELDVQSRIREIGDGRSASPSIVCM